MKGHIEITDKVYFVPDGLPKPDSVIYDRANKYYFDCEYYQEIIKAYEASKKTVEVSNVYFSTLAKAWLFRRYISHKLIVKNNQECEAKVTDKALITKIL